MGMETILFSSAEPLEQIIDNTSWTKREYCQI